MSSIPSWLADGSKIVCIRTMVRPDGGPVPGVNEIYLARDAHIIFGEVYVGLSGMMTSDPNPFGGARGPFWPGSWFRPAVEPKSEAEDVALFKRLLNQPVPVDA